MASPSSGDDRPAPAAAVSTHDDAVLLLRGVRGEDGSLVDATVDFANEAWRRIQAPDLPDVSGRSFRRDFESLASDRWPMVVEALDTGRPLSLVYTGYGHPERWGEVHVTALGGDRLLVTVREVTGSEEHREALRQTYARFRAALDRSPDSIALLRPVLGADGRLRDVEPIFMNRAALDRWYGGAELEALSGMRLFERTPTIGGQLRDIYRGVLETGETFQEVMRFDSPLGVFWARLSVARTAQGLVHTSQDITEAVRARERAAESQTRFEAVVNTVEESIVILRPVREHGALVDMEVEWANPAWIRRERLDGRDPAGMRGFELHPEFQAIGPLIEKAMETGAPQSVEVHLADGRWLAASISSLGDRALVASLDVTARRAAHEASRDRLISALDRAHDAVSITDADGRLVYVNDAFEVIARQPRQAVLGQIPHVLLPGPDGAPSPIVLQLRRGQPWQGTVERGRPDGTTVVAETGWSPVHDSAGTLTGFVGITRDVTAARAEAAQRARAERLEAIGQLAGGVAHDFNNLLAVISGYAGFALEQAQEGSADPEDLAEVIAATERAAVVVRQLLAFSRQQPVEPHLVHATASIGAMLPMLRRLIGEHIEINADLAADTPPILVDPGQLDQVLMNLVVNAHDAMPDGGRIDVSCAPAELDGHRIARITVADTGTGMDAVVLEHLFEPFYTTKEVGKGTGLGLATVYGIVQAAGGTISVRSVLGSGTVFTIELPATSGGATASASGHREATPGGHERVLVVEDEPGVRAITVRMLRLLGYTVLDAATPAEVLDIARREPSIDLLVSDVRMPGMHGPELADRLRAARPDLRVLFMSGLVDDLGAMAGPGTEVLAKPFAAADLAAAVRRALD